MLSKSEIQKIDNLKIEFFKGAIDAYKRFAQPGITFTPEQEKMIRDFVEREKTCEICGNSPARPEHWTGEEITVCDQCKYDLGFRSRYLIDDIVHEYMDKDLFQKVE